MSRKYKNSLANQILLVSLFSVPVNDLPVRFLFCDIIFTGIIDSRWKFQNENAIIKL